MALSNKKIPCFPVNKQFDRRLLRDRETNRKGNEGC